jgi:glycine cleavage system H protein
MHIPEDLKYTKDHEWARIDNDIATIGITDFAQSELGDIVYIDLPEIGIAAEQSKAFGTIEAVKAVSDLFSPLTGEVVDINNKISDTPEIVNKDPYGEGWLIKIKISKTSELNNLLNKSQYEKLI